MATHGDAPFECRGPEVSEIHDFESDWVNESRIEVVIAFLPSRSHGLRSCWMIKEIDEPATHS
jgi:hypothetical protein